jgi:hypothetical protein
MQEYLLAKALLGILYKYVPEVIPALTIDLKKVDFKKTVTYLQYFASKSIPEEILEEFNEVDKDCFAKPVDPKLGQIN